MNDLGNECEPLCEVRVVEEGELVRVYCGDALVRTLALDSERRYQRLGRVRGGEVVIKA